MPKSEERHVYDVPVVPKHNPLTPADEIALQAVKDHHEVIDDFLKRCHNCGMNVEQQMAAHEAHVALAHRIAEMFFPNQLPKGNQE